MPRLVLPSRRPNNTIELEHVGANDRIEMLLVTIGFDPNDLRPLEIFIASSKTGSDFDSMLDDFAVAVSVALQSGVSAQSLAKSISRVPDVLDGPPIRPASVFGAILQMLARLEKKEI